MVSEGISALALFLIGFILGFAIAFSYKFKKHEESETIKNSENDSVISEPIEEIKN